VTRRKLIVRSIVRTDILRYVRYLLEQETRTAAERFHDAVEAVLEQLLELPGMGTLQTFTHPKLGAIRAWQVPGFQYMYIYYQEVPDGIRVIRILDARRNLRRIFTSPRKKLH